MRSQWTLWALVAAGILLMLVVNRWDLLAMVVPLSTLVRFLVALKAYRSAARQRKM